MNNIAFAIIELLRKYYETTGVILSIGTVESATGGGLGDKITNVPGSSDFYKGSVIAYSNEVKNLIVGVDQITLSSKGAVSPEVAAEMAIGGRRILGVDICISDTGIAGPSGATPGKPLGLFYLGLAAHDKVIVNKHIFNGNREDNKQMAVETALLILKDYLETRLKKLKTSNFEEKHVVTAFLRNEDKILILRRSNKVGTYKGYWSGVSGYMEKDDLEQAITEIKEETGLLENDITLIKKGNVLTIIDENVETKWIIHPFLFIVTEPRKIVLDWENIEFLWIRPEDLGNYRTVPGLKEAFKSVQ